MAKLLRSLLNRTLLSGRDNLVSRHDHYVVMKGLLEGHDVTGIIDAGASDGRISRRLLPLFPSATCYLFEPNTDYAEALDALAGESDRIRPFQVALADREDERELKITQTRGPTSLYTATRRAHDSYGDEVGVRETRHVPVVTIDGWAEREAIPPVQLVKLDIQAGEVAALRGGQRMLRDHVLLVYTEVFFNAIYEGGAVFSEIDGCLRESGFVLYNIYGLHSDENDMLVHGNAMYVHAERMGM